MAIVFGDWSAFVRILNVNDRIKTTKKSHESQVYMLQ